MMPQSYEELAVEHAPFVQQLIDKADATKTGGDRALQIQAIGSDIMAYLKTKVPSPGLIYKARFPPPPDGGQSVQPQFHHARRDQLF